MQVGWFYCLCLFIKGGSERFWTQVINARNQQQNETSLPANDLKASQAAWFPQGGALPVRSRTGRFDQPPVSNQAVQGDSCITKCNAVHRGCPHRDKGRVCCRTRWGVFCPPIRGRHPNSGGVAKSGTRYMTFLGYLPFTWRWKQLLQSGSSPPSAQQMVHLFQMFPEPWSWEAKTTLSSPFLRLLHFLWSALRGRMRSSVFVVWLWRELRHRHLASSCVPSAILAMLTWIFKTFDGKYHIVFIWQIVLSK